MIESEIEKDCTKFICTNYKVKSLKLTNGGGIPDRIYIKNNKCFFIEFKATGKKPTTEQTICSKLLKNVYNSDTYVIDKVDKELLTELYYRHLDV